MDNFPIRRGIGLSRTPQPNFVPQSFHHPKQMEPFNRTLPPHGNPPNPIQHLQLQLGQPTQSKGHHRALSGTNMNVFTQKNAVTDATNTQIMYKQMPPAIYQMDNPSFKIPSFLPTPLNKDQNQPPFFPSQPRAEKKPPPFNRSLEENTAFKDTVTIENKSTPPIEPKIVHPVAQPQPNPSSISDLKMQESLINSKIEEAILDLKRENTAKEKQWLEQLQQLQKENQSLKEQLRIKEIGKGLSAENEALKHQIAQHSLSLKQCEQKARQAEQQLKSKLSTVEYELRLLKGNKNRLQIQIQSNKKLVKSEREKNEKAKQKINKLIFFQDDLIHAKDYEKLKEEVEYVMSENAKLFQQHQQYIIEVGQQRKKTEETINELETELRKLKIEYGEYRQKISQVLQGGEDKMMILKLQAQINFLKKKNEDQSQQLYTREKQLEQALMDIKELASKDNYKQENTRNVLDQLNVRQIQQTVSMYQARLQDLSENLERKQRETEKQKKTIELLTSELRHVREDKHINSMKGKCSEDSLKNEVEILVKGHQTEIQVKNKKICNLEDSIIRKSKEIAEKDKFIKDFLLSRAKQLESASSQDVLAKIREYFQPEHPQQS